MFFSTNRVSKWLLPFLFVAIASAVEASFVLSPVQLSKHSGVVNNNLERQESHPNKASSLISKKVQSASLLQATVVGFPSLPMATTTTTKNSEIVTDSYKHKDWTITYKYKPASLGYENSPPLLLIHPVGIGLSSWFWERFMELEGPAMYAPNLIGCGIHEKSDPWDPARQDLSIPLGWVEGCESFMQHIKTAARSKQQNPFSSLFGTGIGPSTSSWTVVTQGGLAPIGVLLADRNPTMVKNLIMMSPPTWKDMTTVLSEEELTKNYDFYKNQMWGKIAFSLLESRWAVRLFSNLFLYGPGTKDTDIEKEWLDKAMMECGETSRPPIMAFNSGLCNSQSYESQLLSLQQPTLILQGDKDNLRHVQRRDYEKQMNDCRIQTIQGKNILAWDSSIETMKAILTSKFYQKQ